jgi:hypothetical protein
MKFDDIKKQAKDDTDNIKLAIDLDELSLKIPSVHLRWLDIISQERLSLFKYEQEYDELKKLKWEYYMGRLSQEELKKLNWQPFQTRLVRSDVDVYLNSDPDLNKIRARIVLQREKVSFCDAFLREVMNRQWNIKNALEHRKFMSGG